jgi:hypothetical protein
MQLTKSEATELGKTMTAKEIAAHLSTTNNTVITEAWVKSAFKQLNIATKSLRNKNPLVIVDDTTPESLGVTAFNMRDSNSDDLTTDQQEHLFANND